MSDHYETGADEGERTIVKRTVTCNGRKVRMEFYPGHGPTHCPCCGKPLDHREAVEQEEY